MPSRNSDEALIRSCVSSAQHGGCLQRSLDALYARAYARQAINQKLRVELDATRKAKAAQREAWQEKVMEFVKQAEATRVQMAHLRKQYSG